MRAPSLIYIWKADQETGDRRTLSSQGRCYRKLDIETREETPTALEPKLVPPLRRDVSPTTYSPNLVRCRINELETDYTLSAGYPSRVTPQLLTYRRELRERCEIYRERTQEIWRVTELFKVYDQEWSRMIKNYGPDNTFPA